MINSHRWQSMAKKDEWIANYQPSKHGHWNLLVLTTMSVFERCFLSKGRYRTTYQTHQLSVVSCVLIHVIEEAQRKQREWNAVCQVPITRSDTFRSEACIHADNCRIFLVSQVEKWKWITFTQSSLESESLLINGCFKRVTEKPQSDHRNQFHSTIMNVSLHLREKLIKLTDWNCEEPQLMCEWILSVDHSLYPQACP